MKNLLVYSLFAVIILFYACEDMNDKHDKYFREGEKIYIGKVDSVKTFSGDERIKFRYWLSDPRAKTLKIYWSNKKDSITIPVAPHAARDSFDIIIGGQKAIAENNYTFQLVSYDGEGNYSVTVEKNANVYGSRYKSRLTNKIVSSIELSETGMVINWAAPTNAEDAGIETVYTDLSGNPVKRLISNEDMRYEVIENGMAKNFYKLELEDIDYSKGVKYRTLYLPESSVIDTFYTQSASVEIIRRINVAFGKTATSSDNLNASFPASNAVDGVFADASRWVSTASGEHWLEIDLGEEYNIDGFKTWNGSSGQFNTPIPKFDFQIWSNGAWVSLVSVDNNTNAQYAADFETVSADRVRFYSYSQTRLFEIEVYNTVKY
jgi:hypothetical protein